MGACCTDSGCAQISVTDCVDQGGFYWGDGSSCGDDGDQDGVAFICDNCPHVFNPDQTDFDVCKRGSRAGEGCSSNADCRILPSDFELDPLPSCIGDGFGDVCDNCNSAFNDQTDMDARCISTSTGSDQGPCFTFFGLPYSCNDVALGGPCSPSSPCECVHDGLGNACDNCPRVDLDGEYAVNPDQTDTDGDGIGDICDECPNDPKADFIPCHEILVGLVVRPEPTPFNKTPGFRLPESALTFVENACFVVEIWVMDTHEPKNDPGGVACVYVDLLAGTPACPLRFFKEEVQVDPLFTAFVTGNVNNDPTPAILAELGGCTLTGGLGLHRWQRLAWVAVDGPGVSGGCKSLVGLRFADTFSSLFGKPSNTIPTLPGDMPVAFASRGSIYDLDGDKTVGPGDLGLFAPCWMRHAVTSCTFADFDCDGVVGPSDLSFFAAAWMRDVKDPAIAVPHCQFACPTAGVTDGGGTYRPATTPEMIEAFGLRVPPPEWSGSRLNPDYNPPQLPSKYQRRRSLRGTEREEQ